MRPPRSRVAQRRRTAGGRSKASSTKSSIRPSRPATPCPSHTAWINPPANPGTACTARPTGPPEELRQPAACRQAAADNKPYLGALLSELLECFLLLFLAWCLVCLALVVVVVVVLLPESAADTMSGAPARVAARTASTATLNFIGLGPIRVIEYQPPGLRPDLTAKPSPQRRV